MSVNDAETILMAIFFGCFSLCVLIFLGYLLFLRKNTKHYTSNKVYDVIEHEVYCVVPDESDEVTNIDQTLDDYTERYMAEGDAMVYAKH